MSSGQFCLLLEFLPAMHSPTTVTTGAVIERVELAFLYAMYDLTEIHIVRLRPFASFRCLINEYGTFLPRGIYSRSSGLPE